MARGTATAIAMLAVLLLGVAIPRARAGGTEFPAAGTRALARGGAFLARADDPMTLLYNPANLAGIPGIQLSLQTHLALYSACMDRRGTYTTYGERAIHDETDPTTIVRGDSAAASRFNDDGAFPSVEMPEVCNSGPPGIVPELVLTWRIHKMVGIGVGLVAPAGVGHTVWGEDRDIAGRTYRGLVETEAGILPAPTRYNLIEEQLIIAFPTIGVGFAPHPRIRIGAAFGFGFGLFDFVTITRATRGEQFSGDILSELSATDGFIPRLTVSLHFVPVDALDVMVGFTWTDSIKASGDLKLTSGYYRVDPLDELTVDGVELSAPQPWQASVGIRYADRIAPRPEDPNQISRLTGRVEDQMANERWDIELDFVYERNSLVNEFLVTVPPNPMDARGWGIEADDFFIAQIPASLSLPHNWQDQYSFRLGGSYNVMPGLASVHLGGSFETNGAEPGFEQLDFLNFQRFGIHAGLTMRIGRLDVSLAYAHIHQFAETTRGSEARIEQVTAAPRIAELCRNGQSPSPALCADPPENTEPEGGTPTITNIARFTSNFDVISLGLTYHFQ